MTTQVDFVDWDRLRIFRTVVDAGSFTAAARKLDLSQSAVSRQICSLEESLRIALFYRHARGLRLTEHGEAFHEAVKGMEDQLANALERVANARTRAEGPLRITTTVAFGSAWLSPRIARFHERYPDIAVSVLLVDSPPLDLLARQADVAIRFEEQTRGDLIQQRLMNLRYHLYASRAYLERRGTPANLADLDRHELIVYGGGHEAPLKDFDWILHAGREPGNERRPALKVNNVYGMFRAVRAGLGIAALPLYIVEDAPELVEVLSDQHSPSFSAYLVYAADMRASRRVAALRDFLMQEVSAEGTSAEDAAGATAEGAAAPVCLQCRHVHAPGEPCVYH
jgi:DNA-binding transcriptional LysR family regulator